MAGNDDRHSPLAAMCADIVDQYHSAIHGSLTRIRQALAAFAARAQSPAAREMCEVFAELTEQIHRHLAKEEHLVFPALSALDAAPTLPPRSTFVTVLHPIRLLEAEHRRIEVTLDRMRELALTIAEPDSLSETFRQCMSELADLDRHLRERHRIENEELFPRALEIERQVL